MRTTLPSIALLITATPLVSAALWTGDGDGLSWDDPLNWENASPPSADDTVWDIPADASVAIDGNAPGGTLIKRGEGTLRWEGAASADTVQVEQGTFDSGGGIIWPEVTLAGGTLSGWILKRPATVTGGTLAARTEGPLRMTGGPIAILNSSIAGMVILDGATVQGDVYLESGLWNAPWSGSNRIEGDLHLGAGSSLSWSLQDSLQIDPLVVTGALSSDYTMCIYFGLPDWTLPYWDVAHDVRFIDVWEGSIVTASFVTDPYAGNESEGTWSQVDDPSGDIVFRWTPLDQTLLNRTPVPEASSVGWTGLVGILAMGVRMLRRRA